MAERPHCTRWSSPGQVREDLGRTQACVCSARKAPRLLPPKLRRDTGIERVVFLLSRFQEEAAGTAGDLFRGCLPAGPPPTQIRALLGSPALMARNGDPKTR